MVHTTYLDEHIEQKERMTDTHLTDTFQILTYE